MPETFFSFNYCKRLLQTSHFEMQVPKYLGLDLVTCKYSFSFAFARLFTQSVSTCKEIADAS